MKKKGKKSQLRGNVEKRLTGIQIPKEDRENFINTILNPEPPVDALLQTAKRYLEIMK